MPAQKVYVLITVGCLECRMKTVVNGVFSSLEIVNAQFNALMKQYHWEMKKPNIENPLDEDEIAPNVVRSHHGGDWALQIHEVEL